MKKGRLTLLMLLNGCSFNGYRGSPWDTFLKQPSEKAFVVLEKTIAKNAQPPSYQRDNVT